MGPDARVTVAATTTIQVAISGLTQAHLGKLKAVVSLKGGKAAAVEVATIQELALEVNKVGPLNSPIEGGSVVTISGKNFQYDMLQCQWGSASVTPAHGNGTVATCLTPQHSVGNASLTISAKRSRQAVDTKASLSFYPTL